MHNRGIVLAGKDVARPSHIGGELVDLFDASDCFLCDSLVAEVTDDELVRRRLAVFMFLDVHSPDPNPLGFQSLNNVATYEAARAGH